MSVQNRIIAKVSRPEVAEAFLSPAPAHVLERLVSDNRLTAGEAALAKEIPMADDICVEADSGGHTDQGIPYTLMPAMIRLRDRMMEKHGYAKKVRIGAAGASALRKRLLRRFCSAPNLSEPVLLINARSKPGQVIQ
ncbi:Polyketide biosynthesis protein PksE [Bacillus velezensis]